MGDKALLVDEHEFDLFGTVTVGQRSCFGSIGTVVFAHGLNRHRPYATIGEDTYVGAPNHFGPGPMIGNQNVGALGSVVISKIDVPRHLVAGAVGLVDLTRD